MEKEQTDIEIELIGKLIEGFKKLDHAGANRVVQYATNLLKDQRMLRKGTDDPTIVA